MDHCVFCKRLTRKKHCSHKWVQLVSNDVQVVHRQQGLSLRIVDPDLPHENIVPTIILSPPGLFLANVHPEEWVAYENQHNYTCLSMWWTIQCDSSNHTVFLYSSIVQDRCFWVQYRRRWGWVAVIAGTFFSCQLHSPIPSGVRYTVF